MIIPTKDECFKILHDNKVPDNIIAHSKAVCDFAIKVADLLEDKGININKDLVVASALLHDIKKINSNDHLVEGYELIKSLGFPEVAVIVKKHGLVHVGKEEFTPNTWEEKTVFYADKRIKNDKIVSVDERFEYIKQRYKRQDVEKEFSFTKELEKELLGEEKIE